MRSFSAFFVTIGLHIHCTTLPHHSPMHLATSWNMLHTIFAFLSPCNKLLTVHDRIFYPIPSVPQCPSLPQCSINSQTLQKHFRDLLKASRYFYEHGYTSLSVHFRSDLSLPALNMAQKRSINSQMHPKPFEMCLSILLSTSIAYQACPELLSERSLAAQSNCSQ